jgi:hypothetical protein
MKDKKGEKLKQLGKKTLFIGIFLVVLFIFVTLSILRIKNNAVENSVLVSTSIPLPSQSDIIYSNNGFIYNSIGCYHGYSVIFIGSYLEISEKIQSHRQYFLSKGWYVDPRNFDIDCAFVDPNYDDREEIDNFGNIYKTTYWIVVKYEPSSDRYNLCDCCSLD